MLMLPVLLVSGLWQQPATAQDPLVTLPDNYRSIFDNPEVTVIRAHYGAHEKISVHDHTAFATVFVYLSDSGQVRIDHAENGSVESVVRPPTVKGAYRVAAGIKERHSIENLGDSSSDFLRVELKHVSLATLKEPFRGKAPQSITQSQNAIEFTVPGLQIERILCVPGSLCEAKASTASSLLITFAPAALASGKSGKTQLSAGAVHWLPASQAATLTPDAASGAQFLRILLPSSTR